MELARRLRAARHASGLSQRAVAKRLGVTQQAVSMWERGTRAPGREHLVSLARLYGVTLEWLINNGHGPQEEDEPGPKQGQHDRGPAPGVAVPKLTMPDQWDATELGRRLAKARKRAGLTQEKAGQELGLTSEAIAQYEKGKLRPSPDVLRAMAILYRVSADELLDITILKRVSSQAESTKSKHSGAVDVTTIAAHANPPPPGWDLEEWERQARQKLEEVLQELRRDWERRRQQQSDDST